MDYTVESQRLYSLSRQILSSIKENDWRETAALIEQRQSLLEDFFAEDVPEAHARMVADLVLALQNIDQECQEVLFCVKDDLSLELSKYKKNIKALHEYSSLKE